MRQRLKPRARRNATESEKQARAQKKQADERRKEAAARERFVKDLSAQKQVASSSAPPPSNAAADEDQQQERRSSAEQTDSSEAGTGVADSAQATEPSPEASHVLPGGAADRNDADATASFRRPLEREGDDVECAEVDDSGDALDPAEDSVMRVYARKILLRLRAELSDRNATDNWLLRKLTDNSGWLRSADARDVLMRLSASSDPASWPDAFYIRDIFFWLPDVRWGEMPTCPRCLLNDEVRVHDYRLNHPSRRCTIRARPAAASRAVPIARVRAAACPRVPLYLSFPRGFPSGSPTSTSTST